MPQKAILLREKTESPFAVVSKIIITGHINDAAPSRAQRKENLNSSISPNF